MILENDEFYIAAMFQDSCWEIQQTTCSWYLAYLIESHMPNVGYKLKAQFRLEIITGFHGISIIIIILLLIS